MQKKLYRSTTNKQIAGVAGGLSEYTGIDDSLIRVGLVILVLFTGIFPGVIGYIVAAIIIPKDTER